MALTNKLTAIADAIREKTETTDLLKLDEMPTAISNIQAGGGKYKPRYMYQPIKFQNYTGTELDHETQMLDTTYFTDMYQMFGYSKKITSLDLSGWNTSNVTSMNSMFCYCESLTSLDVSSFDTSKVTNMYQMFGYCKNLTELDLSNFDTSNVTTMNSMFYGCNNITKLDIRNFTFDKVTSYSSMFGVKYACLIIVKGQTEKEWITSKFSDYKNVKTVAELEV